MEAWLTPNKQTTNKKGDTVPSATVSPNADTSTGTGSPKMTELTASTPNALSNSALQATLVPPNELLR
jgi:hypothetical protein